MTLSSSLMALLGALALLPGAPLFLDNGKIRVELEPRTFSVRFLGTPGGRNFLEPAHISASELAGAGWLEPGGISTDLLPVSPENAALRRGPAEVVERRDDYILLLGPEQPDARWRFKKEFELVPGAPELTYKLTVLSALKEERRVRVRTTAQLPWAGEITLPRAQGRLDLVRGACPGFMDLIGGEGEHYAIPLASRARRDRAVLESPASELTVATPFGQWTRRMEIRGELVEAGEAGQFKMLALLDDTSHAYQAALEGAQSGVNVGAPMVIVEHWSIELAAGTKQAQPVGAGELEETLP